MIFIFIEWGLCSLTRFNIMSAQKDHQTLLWEGISQGDHQAFNTLMRTYTSSYYPFVYRWVGQQQFAEDILQEAFLKLWTKPHAFNPAKGKFQTWFYRVLSNLCIDFFRRNKNKVFMPQEFLNDMAFEEATQLDKSVNIAEKKELLQQIAKLSAKEQAVLHLFYFEEFSTHETAKILGKSVRSTESLLYRSKKNLQKIIQGSHHG